MVFLSFDVIWLLSGEHGEYRALERALLLHISLTYCIAISQIDLHLTRPGFIPLLVKFFNKLIQALVFNRIPQFAH